MGRWREEDGAVSAMVAVVAAGLVACAGLAYDGGQIINATATARDVAAAAARTGAQHIAPAALHTGHTTLDPTAATAAADRFLTDADMHGTVTVDGSTITVTAVTVQPLRILPLGDRTIAATASATATSDVLETSP